MVNLFPCFTSDIKVYFNDSTPVFIGDGEVRSGFAAMAAAGDASGFDFGIDPNVDPELALALRVSLEEERARQETAAKRAAEEASGQGKGEEPSSKTEDTTLAQPANTTALEENRKAPDEMVGVFFLTSIFDCCTSGCVKRSLLMQWLVSLLNPIFFRYFLNDASNARILWIVCLDVVICYH